jgi:hypothetical protein
MLPRTSSPPGFPESQEVLGVPAVSGQRLKYRRNRWRGGMMDQLQGEGRRIWFVSSKKVARS